MRALILLAVGCTVLAACAPGRPPSTVRDRIDRTLARAPGQAQPSEIVATELAFARMAREKGQWTAFSEYAADNALIFGLNGGIEAKPWLAKQQNPAEAVQWQPHFVWMSCDGTQAVTQGGFHEPGGEHGTFYTVWSRQRDGQYRYVFDFGFAQEQPPEEHDIIGSAIAECDGAVAQRGDRPPTPEAPAFMSSLDGSLAWGFQYSTATGRRFHVSIRKGGTMERVIDVSVAAGKE